LFILQQEALEKRETQALVASAAIKSEEGFLFFSFLFFLLKQAQG
jgi:hypothetical protein